MSAIKEPQYFAEDIRGGQRKIRTLREYLNCFAAANGQKRIGEASTVYLGSKEAAGKIKHFSSDAQIIIMLRNPVDVMYAEHSERVFSNLEHIGNFEAAVDSNVARKHRVGPFKGQTILCCGYRELSRFAQPVKTYFEIFGRENVHVIVYDDLEADSSEVFAGVLRFLQVAEAPGKKDSRINANRRARNMAVQDFLRHPPKRLRRLARMILPQSLRLATGNAVRRLNVVYEPRAPLGEMLRARLQRECRPDIEELSRLINRDLSHWCGSGHKFP